MNRLKPLPPAPPPGAGASLKILSGRNKGKQLRLMGAEILIGRHRDCDIVLKDNKACSRKHARIFLERGLHLIESLKKGNPVLVNKQPVLSPKTLKEGDRILLGDFSCVFAAAPAAGGSGGSALATATPNRRPPSLAGEAGSKAKAGAPLLHGNRKKKPPKALFLLVAAGAFFLLFSEKEDAKEQEASKIKTEKEMQAELQAMQDINEEEEKELMRKAPEEGEARVAFIKGFRDYRKGFFHRAEQHFNHCLTLNKKYKVCESYVRQSRDRIERLIQKKMLLGKEYRENSQYRSCAAAFQSVEIMVRDESRILFKEARENRRFCEMKMHNRI